MARKSRIGLTTAAISASFLAGIAVAGGLPGSDDPGRHRTDLTLTSAALRPATSCEQLRQWYVDRALDQVTAWGWGNPYPVYYLDDVGGSVFGPGSGVGAAASAPAPTARAEDAVSASDTGTNVQEAGVDEPDSVKTDGSLLVTVDGPRLTTYDVSGDTPVMLASIVLPDLQDAQILLSGHTVVAVGADTAAPQRRGLPGRVFPGFQRDTRVVTVDVTDPAAPAITDSRAFDAEAVAIRQHGDVIRLVLSSGLPDLPFTTPRGGRRSEAAALQRNRQVVRDSVVADWLPAVTDDTGATRPAVACDDVALPRDDAGLGLMSVVAFHAESPADADTTGVATSTQTAYLSQDRLYLATSPWIQGGWIPGPSAPRVLPDLPLEPPSADPVSPDPVIPDPVIPQPVDPVDPWPVDPVDPWPVDPGPIGPAPVDDGVTRLYSFSLEDTSTAYLAAGAVEGEVASRWAMDAVDGWLRVAVGPTAETGDFNSVVTLAERDGALVETGRVDALGVGEQIKSVRWFDDLAVLVTFRQTDPLYAVDLADPARPRLLGELKIPGFSEYLHPIGDDLLLGVGQDATRQGSVRGAQLALFDLSDLGSPQRLDTVGFGVRTSALAGQDPRQFTWLPDRQTALTVVSDWRTGIGSVAIVRVDGGRLTSRTVEVEAGRDVSRVRLVPVSGGKVVLWTGSEVSFLAVG